MSWLPLPSWRRILGFVLKQCTKCQASEVLRLCVAEMSAYDLGFNRSTQQFVDIALLVFRSPASCVAVR